MRRSARHETKTVIGEIRIKDRHQHLCNGLPDQPVGNCGKTKGPGTPGWFRNFHSFDRQGMIDALVKLRADTVPVFLEKANGVGYCHMIDTGRSLYWLSPVSMGKAYFVWKVSALTGDHLGRAAD